MVKLCYFHFWNTNAHQLVLQPLTACTVYAACSNSGLYELINIKINVAFLKET